jgi:hypothetical protein
MDCGADQSNQPVLELFDLTTDPYEERNLVGEADHANKLGELKDWVAEIALQMVRNKERRAKCRLYRMALHS